MNPVFDVVFIMAAVLLILWVWVSLKTDEADPT